MWGSEKAVTLRTRIAYMDMAIAAIQTNDAIWKNSIKPPWIIQASRPHLLTDHGKFADRGNQPKRKKTSVGSPSR